MNISGFIFILKKILRITDFCCGDEVIAFKGISFIIHEHAMNAGKYSCSLLPGKAPLKSTRFFMHKRFFIPLLGLLFVLVFSSFAQAEVKTAGNISVDVPEGWTLVEEGEAVALVTDDGNAEIIIMTLQSGGLSKDIFAANIANEFDADNFAYDEESGGYTFTFVDDWNTPMKAWATVEGETALLLMLTGKHPQMLEIIKSVRIAK